MIQLGCKAVLWPALAALVVGLFVTAPASAADEEPILVGANLSMTGSVSAFGQMCWDGMQIAQLMRPKALWGGPSSWYWWTTRATTWSRPTPPTDWCPRRRSRPCWGR